MTSLPQVVPPVVRKICETLQAGGFEAYTVGGAVRDALLGRTPGDWDVTTSARPEEVQKLFRRTIATGLEHGTVTVMLGRGDERMGVEVTTFRGEGAYTDGRRPDSVVFGVPLEEDLARRDFVINAMAYDPVRDVLADPFGGAGDLERKLVRAVGDAAERFREDGLRIMRAVRFCAVLDFSLDPATESAMAAGLPSLAKVSNERVRVELLKMLAAEAPWEPLSVAKRRGLWRTVFPELEAVPWDAALARARSLDGALLRLAALLRGIGKAPLTQALKRLTLSNADLCRVVTVEAHADVPDDIDAAGLRRTLGLAGRDQGAADLVAMWRAEGRAELARRAAAILSAGDPLTVKELAMAGRDLMSRGVAPGPELGALLAQLFEHVLVHPEDNNVTRLDQVLATLRSGSSTT